MLATAAAHVKYLQENFDFGCATVKGGPINAVQCGAVPDSPVALIQPTRMFDIEFPLCRLRPKRQRGKAPFSLASSAYQHLASTLGRLANNSWNSLVSAQHTRTVHSMMAIIVH
jgi:hypothetical protein